MYNKHHHTTSLSLEYAALLSGLSMVGDTISDHDIESTRQSHIKNHKQFGNVTFAVPATDSKRWGSRNG